MFIQIIYQFTDNKLCRVIRLLFDETWKKNADYKINLIQCFISSIFCDSLNLDVTLSLETHYKTKSVILRKRFKWLSLWSVVLHYYSYSSFLSPTCKVIKVSLNCSLQTIGATLQDNGIRKTRSVLLEKYRDEAMKSCHQPRRRILSKVKMWEEMSKPLLFRGLFSRLNLLNGSINKNANDLSYGVNNSAILGPRA